jgi:hypothetical protein
MVDTYISLSRLFDTETSRTDAKYYVEIGFLWRMVPSFVKSHRRFRRSLEAGLQGCNESKSGGNWRFNLQSATQRGKRFLLWDVLQRREYLKVIASNCRVAGERLIERDFEGIRQFIWKK